MSDITNFLERGTKKRDLSDKSAEDLKKVKEGSLQYLT